MMAAAFLFLLPMGSWFAVPVAGAAVTPGDVLVVAMAAVGVVIAGRRIASGPARPGALGPEEWALLLAVGFGVWACASALWSTDPRYALVKGAGYGALALAAAGVAGSGLGWGRAVDAWLAGTGVMVLVTGVLAVVGPEAAVERIVQGAAGPGEGSVARLRGPFRRPAELGDYLVISAVLLWVRWPTWRTGEGGGTRRWVRAVAAVGSLALVAALTLTLSTAWLAAGVLLLLWGRRTTPSDSGASPAAWIPSLALRGGGAAITAVAMAALVYPLRIEWAGLRLSSSGLRPDIWADAAGALQVAPIRGVGATPFVARTPDPLDPTAAGQLWEAQNAYLSVAGQYGLLGLALLAGAGWMLMRAVRRGAGGAGGAHLSVVESREGAGLPASVVRRRARTAAMAVLLAVAVHGVAVAGEDFRHWWAAAGVVALMAAARGRDGRGAEGGGAGSEVA